MTREERAVLREQRLKAELEAKGRELAQVQAQNRAAARAKRVQRRQVVGTLADAAGLFVWDDNTIALLFQALATLHATPAPVAVLESRLASPRSLDAVSVHGMAHAPHTPHGAAPDGAVGALAR
jgi:hypothetical protein